MTISVVDPLHDRDCFSLWEQFYCALHDRDCFSLWQLINEMELDVNLTNEKGMTPLHYAADFLWLAGIETLLEAGAVPVKDKHGRTPQDFLDLSSKWIKHEGNKLFNEYEKLRANKGDQ